MMITMCAESAGESFYIGWVSLQPDGSISVGLNDRALTVRAFEAQEFVWSAFNRTTVEFFAPDEPSAGRTVINPHLTFHPPDWLHLTGGKGVKLFEAIAPIDLAVQQQGTVPWVRFVSKAAVKLREARGLRGGAMARVIRFPISSLDSSVALEVDFVAAADQATDAVQSLPTS